MATAYGIDVEPLKQIELDLSLDQDDFDIFEAFEAASGTTGGKIDPYPELHRMRRDEPVCHLSYYEADAYARWAEARLPTEVEWEAVAAGRPTDGNFAEQERFHPAPARTEEEGPAQLFGDVWEQPELNKRDRSLVTVAVLTAMYRTDELKGHMKRALDNGVTQEELQGLITHLAFYAGWPTAVNAGRVALEVFDQD